jgi:hypothetical protein
MRKTKVQPRDKREAALAKVTRQQIEEVVRASFEGQQDLTDLLMEAVFAPTLQARLQACEHWEKVALALREKEAARIDIPADEVEL